ncbi:MAG: MFS transporter [Candidatus Caldarchaeum sp.]
MPKPRIFYGWYIVGASFLLIILDGLLLYSFGVFLPFLEKDFNISRAIGSSIFAFRSVVLAFSLTIAGRLVDRYDPRVVVFSGGVIAALGLLMSSVATSAWHLYITYGLLIGLGDGVLYITCVAIVSRWFIKKRSFVIGLITTGIPLSGFIVPPLTEWLITTFGVREAFVWLALIFTATLTSSFILRSNPQNMNLKAYGEEPREAHTGGPSHFEEASWSLTEAIRTSVFWIMYAIYSFGFLTFLIVVIHLFSYVVDSGIPTNRAAFAPAFIGIGSIVGRVIITGYVTEVLRSERVLFLCFLLQGVSIVLILLVKEIWSFYLFGIMFGIFYSGWVPIFPHILGNFFGLNSLGSIYGFFGTSFCLAAVSGPLIAGYIYQKTGSYHYAFSLTIAFCLVAAISTFMIRTPSRSNKVRRTSP